MLVFKGSDGLFLGGWQNWHGPCLIGVTGPAVGLTKGFKMARTNNRLLGLYAQLANTLPAGSTAQRIAVARWLAYATI